MSTLLLFSIYYGLLPLTLVVIPWFVIVRRDYDGG